MTPAERSALEACPTTRLHFVPNCGHMLPNQTPDRVAELIVDTVATAPQPTATTLPGEPTAPDALRPAPAGPVAVGPQPLVSQGVLYQGTVRSSPKWGNALVAAKRVMCEICSPSSVSTSSETARPISVCGSLT